MQLLNNHCSNNLNLWHSGDALVGNDPVLLIISHNYQITATAAANPNTIVVVHSVGQINMEAWVSNPNVTAIVSISNVCIARD